jgi:hypothetical protein
VTEKKSAPDRGRDRFRVRPYALTGGRTRSENDLPLETLVRATDEGREALSMLAFEQKEIVNLCESPIAIVEVAARLDVHLGVARVLVGDMSTEGYVEALATHSKDKDSRPDVKLLERVLDGLQSL